MNHGGQVKHGLIFKSFELKGKEIHPTLYYNIICIFNGDISNVHIPYIKSNIYIIIYIKDVRDHRINPCNGNVAGRTDR